MSSTSESPNSHITTYLKDYINLHYSPEFAVLLRGAWGSGKTFFIKRFLADFEGKYIFISLNGVSKISEIEEFIFQQLHPVLSSPSMKIAGKVLKGLLRTTIKVDLNNDGTNETTLTGAGIDNNKPQRFKKLEDQFIVFDDLERCTIPLVEILGYITQFVEDYELKVIMLGDEENGQLKKDKKTYSRIKEKLIGKTFKIEPEPEIALIDFLKIIKNDKVRVCLEKHKKTIVKSYLHADYKNLRHLKQSIGEFDQFLAPFPEVNLNHKPFIEELLDYFLALSFELKKGVISVNEIHKLTHRIEKLIEDDNPIKKIVEKYSCFGKWNNVIDPKLFEDFFQTGKLDQDQVYLALKKSKHFRKAKDTKDWEKFSQHWKLDEKEYSVLEKKLVTRFKNNEVDSIIEVINLADSFLFYIDSGVCSVKPKEVKLWSISNIDKFSSEGIFELGFSREMKDAINSKGRRKTVGNKTLSEITEYIKLKIDTGKILKIKNEVNLLFNKITSNFDEFRKQVVFDSHWESELENFHLTPVFKHFDQYELAKVVLELTGEAINDFGRMIKYRYHYHYAELSEDKNCLLFLRDKINNHIKQEPFNINKLNFKNSLLDDLDEVLNKMEIK